MESLLKLRISRMFRSSFGSCKLRNVSDIAQEPVFISHRREFHLLEALPKPRSFPSIHRQQTARMKIDGNDHLTKKAMFVSGDGEGRTCPPTSPASPSNSYCNLQSIVKKEKEKLSRKNTNKKKKKDTIKGKEAADTKVCNSFRYSTSSGETKGWFSSEEEREKETETLFSSKSLSSDSSELRKKVQKMKNRRKKRSKRRNFDMGLCPLSSIDTSSTLKGKVKESFAVVKRSNDPYSDFRNSMVEMIVEKQMFAATDLEQLLHCFLSLNSAHHHQIIVEVFSDIWDDMFSICP